MISLAPWPPDGRGARDSCRWCARHAAPSSAGRRGLWRAPCSQEGSLNSYRKRSIVRCNSPSLQDRFQHADEPGLNVSLSIGLATFRPEFQHANMWLNEADKALYIAKNTGRNKVSIGAADTLMDSVLSKP